MQKTILMIVAVALVGCGTTSWVSDPSDPNNVKIEAAIRKAAEKPTGELAKVDLEKVTRLNLRDNQLTDVKGLEKLTQLKYLHLHSNKLTDLKELENLTQLTDLWIGGNQLADASALAKLTQLTSLSFSDGKLTVVPKELEKLTQLKTLYLRNNQLTDVKGLEKLTQLKGLYLENNPDLTKAQIDELQKALPNCSIIHNAKK